MNEASFDSNILIDALNGFQPARNAIEPIEHKWISRISWIEVLAGVHPQTAAETEQFLSKFDIDELDVPIARRAAEFRRERRGFKLPDAVILASAELNGRPLVTRNTRDFPADQPGIRVPYTL